MTARAYKEYMDYCMLKQEYFDYGKKEGYEQGIEDGVEQEKLVAAKNMLAENIPEDMIVRCTGLPLETVRELAGEVSS